MKTKLNLINETILRHTLKTMPNPNNKIPNDFTLMSGSEESVEKLKTTDPRRVKGMKTKAVPVYVGDHTVCQICGETSKTFYTKQGVKLWFRLHLKGKHPEYL